MAVVTTLTIHILQYIVWRCVKTLVLYNDGETCQLGSVTGATHTCLLIPETLYEGDDALNTKPVMHYQGTAYLCC